MSKITLPTGEQFTCESAREASDLTIILSQDDQWFAQYDTTRAEYIAKFKDGGTFGLGVSI